MMRLDASRSFFGALMLVSAGSVLLPGCAADSLAKPQTPVLHPFESQSKSEAQVCAIQTQTKSPTNAAPEGLLAEMVIVRDNGDAVAAVRSGGYACFFAQPGKHVFLTEKGSSVQKTKLAVKAGQRYYLGLDSKDDSTVAPRWIDEKTAKRLLQFTSPSYGEAIAQ